MSSSETLFADRYKMERRLGVGGMATVQLAFDTRLERHVALKLLADHLAQDGAFVSRFRREALAAARLVHPNIVQVFDFGSDEASGRQFIVMEFVDGHSCAEVLRELGRLAPEEAVGILTQACRGLDYAHRHGVIHRDVKPGNLLRSRDGGQVKLADFGIAKAAEQSDITKVGSVLGTAAYLSPEQARGEPAGPASDLYALGVVAYQLLAGRLPYEAASLTDLARQQDQGGPTALHRVDPEIPRALSDVVARALDGDAARRFSDAGELEMALRDGLRGVGREPTGTTRPLAADDVPTQMLAPQTAAGTAATVPVRRRRLEPLQEDVAPPVRRPAPAPAAVAAPATRRRRGGVARTVRALLAVLLLAAVAVAAYLVVSNTTNQGPRLREQIGGDVQQSVRQIRGLIEDNTQ